MSSSISKPGQDLASAIRRSKQQHGSTTVSAAEQREENIAYLRRYEVPQRLNEIFTNLMRDQPEDALEALELALRNLSSHTVSGVVRKGDSALGQLSMKMAARQQQQTPPPSLIESRGGKSSPPQTKPPRHDESSNVSLDNKEQEAKEQRDALGIIEVPEEGDEEDEMNVRQETAEGFTNEGDAHSATIETEVKNEPGIAVVSTKMVEEQMGSDRAPATTTDDNVDNQTVVHYAEDSSPAIVEVQQQQPVQTEDPVPAVEYLTPVQVEAIETLS